MKTKFCWVATQTKKGWRIKLCTNQKDFNVRGLLVKSENDIEKILKAGIVFVHLKDKDLK
ncbi:MAG: hypothetical protein ABIC19_00555 [Patescibacteria group bacterium]|nr:hypothetical protein [Patescibacteria group bacterium]